MYNIMYKGEPIENIDFHKEALNELNEIKEIIEKTEIKIKEDEKTKENDDKEWHRTSLKLLKAINSLKDI